VNGLRSEPLPVRWALIGATVAGLVGGVAGLVIGLHVHAATAWFAVFELGLPAGFAGAILGLLAGCVATAAATINTRRVRRSRRPLP